MDISTLIETLARTHHLSLEGYETLVAAYSPENAALSAARADAVRREIYGTDVYIRGLIEISSICKNCTAACGAPTRTVSATG